MDAAWAEGQWPTTAPDYEFRSLTGWLDGIPEDVNPWMSRSRLAYLLQRDNHEINGESTIRAWEGRGAIPKVTEMTAVDFSRWLDEHDGLSALKTLCWNTRNRGSR